jgi:hypothetical protein
MSKSQVVRGSLAQKVIKKYETTEEVLKEFLENDDFVTRYSTTIPEEKRYSTTIPEEEFENGLESIEDDLEGGNDHQAYKHLKKLGIKEFGKRAEKAIEKIKANTDSINIADLKIFEHLSGHRKIAGDLIRELRDGTFVEDGEFENAQGFVKKLSSFRRALFPGDLEFMNKIKFITSLSEELTKTSHNYHKELQAQLIKYGIFKEATAEDGIVDNKTTPEWKKRYDQVRIIMEDVSTKIRMPTEEEWAVLLGSVPEKKDSEYMRNELIGIIKPKVAVKNKLIPQIREYALNKLGDVVEESRKIRRDLNQYLQNDLSLNEDQVEKAKAIIAKLEKFGGRKDNLVEDNQDEQEDEWNFILQNLRETEERQRAKEMVKAYIMRSERAVDQFIAQRGNINVRNDELRARGIDLNGEDVKNVLAKLEARQNIELDELPLISKDVVDGQLKGFKDRMYELSNNNYIDRSEEINRHQGEIKGILKQNFEDVETEIKKLRSLSGMVDNLSEEEWEGLLKNVPGNKDIARKQIIQSVRDLTLEWWIARSETLFGLYFSSHKWLICWGRCDSLLPSSLFAC